jgi:hypothetical protein
MTHKIDRIAVFGEDVCCLPGCKAAGMEFCDRCNGWYCLDHLKLRVGGPFTASKYLCVGCLSDPEPDHTPPLSR